VISFIEREIEEVPYVFVSGMSIFQISGFIGKVKVNFKIDMGESFQASA